MLYDILPPLFLLGSFGGITAIIARVVGRVQHDQLAHDIKEAAARGVPATDDLLRSNGSRISMVTNRLAFVWDTVGTIFGKIRHGSRQLRVNSKTALKRAQAHLAQARMPKNIIPPVASAVSATVRRVEIAEKPASEAPIIRTILARKKPDDDPLKRAAICLREAQFDQAEDILLPYIVSHTNDTKAYMLLGRAASGREDWGGAIEIFEQVRAMNEKAPRLFSALGAAAFQAGRFTLAVESLQKARDYEPENVVVREQLLTIAQRMDNRVLARSVSEELSQLRQEHAAAPAK